MHPRTKQQYFFFFNDTATTEIYTLSLHDALPICHQGLWRQPARPAAGRACGPARRHRSEEHTSELQSHLNLVCRLLLEKKKRWGEVESTERPGVGSQESRAGCRGGKEAPTQKISQ